MQRRKPITLVLIAVLTAPVCAAADVAGGLIIGDPTGFTLKAWQDRRHAWDLGMGWSTGANDRLNLKLDYTIHQYDVLDVERGQAPVYFGVGVHARFNPDELGVRVPVGINYLFADAPVGVFGELAPTMLVSPDTEFQMALAVGVRYHF